MEEELIEREDVVKNIKFDRGYLSSEFITDKKKMKVVMDDPYILLF